MPITGWRTGSPRALAGADGSLGQRSRAPPPTPQGQSLRCRSSSSSTLRTNASPSNWHATQARRSCSGIASANNISQHLEGLLDVPLQHGILLLLSIFGYARGHLASADSPLRVDSCDHGHRYAPPGYQHEPPAPPTHRMRAGGRKRIKIAHSEQSRSNPGHASRCGTERDGWIRVVLGRSF